MNACTLSLSLSNTRCCHAIDKRGARLLCYAAQFTMGATGDKVKARYTYNYVKEDGVWKIQHHHSSVMPEGIDGGKAITEDEVRGLFGLWNGALATLDPKKVAGRYAKKGVLLPTVSDTVSSLMTEQVFFRCF